MGGSASKYQSIFEPIEYKPHGTTAPTTPSPIVAPKRATSHISASNVLLTRPRIDLPQAVVEDSEDTESSLPEAEPSGGLGDTGYGSAVELSIEEDDSLPAVMASSSFSSACLCLNVPKSWERNRYSLLKRIWLRE
jgi:hypothetical protein